jgi:threonylcarbamoyladenosine tRNA methylthiotransferase MtaB
VGGLVNFSVINLGCKVNRAESDSIAAGLLEKGHNMVPSSQADVIIVNTCTVTGDAEKKTRKAVRRALRENDHAQVLVTGCAVAIDSNFYENLDARIRVVNKAELTSQSSALRIGDQFPLRVSVKVQDGCNHACTYCIVHVARGKAWSRPIDEILNEVKALEQAGIQEIVL